MKVLHIINALTIAGAETLVTNSLAKGGLPEHTENILVFFQHDSILRNKVDERVKIIDLQYKGWYAIGSLLLQIRKLIKEHRPDIIHTHLNPAGWYTAIACPKNVPQVHTIHISYSTDTDTGNVRRFFERVFHITKRKANLITLSPLLKEDLLASVKIKGKVFVLSNFIADSYFLPNPKKEPSTGDLKLIAVGNMRPQKNYAYLLDIFRHLKEYPVSVDVYGFGDHSSFSAIAKKEGIKVNFMGPSENTKDLYWKYDAFIMPSKFEGFGLAAYEAMASGIPAILSDIGAFKSLINDNAFYINLDDAAIAANTIKEIIGKKQELDSMAAKGKAFAEATVKRSAYVDKLLNIYNEIINQNQ